MQPIRAAPRQEDLDDAELASLARQESAQAFCTIMQRNNRRLYRLVRSVLKDDAEAEDALQEAYVRAFTNLGSFKATASLSTWLTRIALNEALARLRRRRSMAELDQVAEAAAAGSEATAGVIPFPSAQIAATGGPEHVSARAEIRRLLERAIDDLPDPFRTVFVLRCVEQMSVEEAAACLGVPEDTVKTRLHRAKQRLRQALGEQLAHALADTFPFAGARCARLRDAVLRRLGIGDAPPSA